MIEQGASFTPQLSASAIAQILWLVPALPMIAAGVIALLKQPRRAAAAALSIGSLGVSLLISLVAFGHVLAGWINGLAVRETVNFAPAFVAVPSPRTP